MEDWNDKDLEIYFKPGLISLKELYDIKVNEQNDTKVKEQNDTKVKE
jgi:hypothetical protein